MLNKIIKIAIIPFFLSILIFSFYTKDIPDYVFISFFTLIFLIFKVKYSISKNLNYLIYIATITCSFFVGYRIVKYNISESYIYFFILGFLLILDKYLSDKKKNALDGSKSTCRIYYERQQDINRLRYLLQNYNIVGINGAWGSGKSFITDQLEDEYILVKIDLLSSNIDDIQQVILHELDKVLSIEGIFSIYSPQLMKFFGQKYWFDSITNIFMNKTGLYSNTIKGFRADLDRLSKNIVLVFEDIDRINNIEAIKKILCIAEKIANNRIKVIYQYHVENLDKIGLSLEYLEKYIPVYMNMTEISFSNVLAEVLKERKIPTDKLNREDFLFLFPYLPPESDLRNHDLYTPIDTKINPITIRRIMQFIDEINNTLDINLFIKHKKKVIGYFFIKYFTPDLYSKLVVGTPILYTFLFDYKNKKYTIIEIMNLLKEQPEIDLKSIYKNNILSSFIIFLLDYTTFSDSKVSSLSKRQLVLNSKHENEKTDRLIWKLMANGKSEYTDAEISINLFYKMVLYQNPQDLEKNFINFCQIWYKKDPLNDLTRDNRNIQHIGESYLLALSKNILLVELEPQDHLLFLKFLFSRNKARSINLPLLECLSYLSFINKDNLMYSIKQFNSLECIGNFNNSKKYKEFLKKYFIELTRFGIEDFFHFEVLDYFIQENKPLTIEYFSKAMYVDAMIEKLRETMNRFPADSIKEDIQLVIAFILKNKELIGCKEEYTSIPNKPIINYQTISTNEDVFYKLDNLDIPDKDFIKELDKEYKNGNISLDEIKRLKRYKK